MTSLELSEIQAYLIKDYKEMGCSKYYLLQVVKDNLSEAKNFIASLAGMVTNVNSAINDTCLNIGFTSHGLETLGLHEENMKSFSREFREDMVTPHRQRLLGDFDSSDPKNWEWGGPDREKIDVILMVFGKDETITDNFYNQLKAKYNTAFKEVHVLKGNPLPDDKEHFGFRDGISQPAIIGSGITGINNDNIKPGEFVMGYKNEYNIYPDTALLEYPQGDVNMLADDASGSQFKDLGKNGTYFVLRQLKEDVDGFWNFLNEKTKNEDGSLNPDESTKVAAKMMGRWPSGAPLVKFPDKDPGGLSDDNDFNYIKEDKLGLKCPFGAHIRRTNPRDNFEESGPGTSLKLTRRHRILRRVRSYGENFVGSATNHKPNGEVGLLFGCFNADISRQFEFIQYTWANYPKFKKLYADPDPFIGVRENPGPGVEQNFTITQPVVNKVITDLQSFVTVKGGAYFFFPSVTVIKFLGTI
jgi:Dyp-type peroxidase family